jgi:hypothetical protein
VAGPISVIFVGGNAGSWRIECCRTIVGESLPAAPWLALHGARDVAPEEDAAFVLRGSTGHVRYVENTEKLALAKVTPPLSRAEATLGAMIPIRKSDVWWELPQDERRAILAQRSKHITLGLDYLPAIARRLYHARELGEPFDFVTWFEYAPEHATRFEDLVGALRATEEWQYVEREVDFRLVRAAP